MRQIATAATLILCAMAALVLQPRALLEHFGLDTRGAQRTPQQLHIFSAGLGQLGALHGIRPISNRMLVDGERFDLGSPDPVGLRLLVIDPSGRPGALQHFDVSKDEHELERLIEQLELAALDSVFALAVAGRVEPEPGAESASLADRLAHFFVSLGAQTQPARAGRCGFAYLCVKRPKGIVPLAESFSSVAGVHLSFQLQADRSVYEDWPMRAVRDERDSIFLAPGAAQGRGIQLESKLHLGARAFGAVSVPVALGSPGQLDWRLGSDARGPAASPGRLSFESRVGLTQGLAASRGGVRFELFVDGLQVAQRVLIDAHAGELGWDLWSTTLDTKLRAVDRVWIRMTRFGPEGTPPLRAYLAQPRLLAGSTGLP